MNREKIKFFYKRETTALGKSFMQNIFLQTSFKISDNFDVSICDGAKQIFLKK